MTQLDATTEKVSKGVKKEKESVRFEFQSAETRRVLAVGGFVVLGEAAEPAIRPLAVLLTNPPTAPYAAMALSSIGQSSVPVLAAALSNENSIVRSRAAYALGEMRPPSVAAVSALLPALHDQARVVRSSTAFALGQIRSRPDIVVRALVLCLGDPYPIVRFTAIQAIGKFGPEADAAIPALAVMTEDEDSSVREAARIVLGKIQETETDQSHILNSPPSH